MIINKKSHCCGKNIKIETHFSPVNCILLISESSISRAEAAKHAVADSVSILCNLTAANKQIGD